MPMASKERQTCRKFYSLDRYDTMQPTNEQMKSNPLSPVLIHLLKGAVYRDNNEKLWQSLLQQQNSVRDFVTILNLTLFIDEAEGYAFLRQDAQNQNISEDDSNTGNNEILPRLVHRRSLNFAVSVLCILLRKKLIEQDTQSSELRIILTKEQIIEMMRIYMPKQNNEARAVEQILTAINKAQEIGILRPLNNQQDSFEVRRIIKAIVDPDWLNELHDKLKEYQEYANRTV